MISIYREGKKIESRKDKGLKQQTSVYYFFLEYPTVLHVCQILCFTGDKLLNDNVYDLEFL